MASLLSALNPVPAFPGYTGPHAVGSVDVEIPIAGLVSPSPRPDGAAGVDTVLFRIFYPAERDARLGRRERVSWLPAPQRLHLSAFGQFLGLGPTLASALSFLPRHLHWISIPAVKNGALLPPPPLGTSPARWPTLIFSHGLGGNRNAYSHLAGSLASYGVVVICPEHRDGSAPLSLTNEVWEARNKQLRIRLWELGLVFEALSAIDRGDEAVVRSNLNGSTPESALAQFAGKLDILEPGRVIFSGHSFGAATVVQLLKSTYYADHPSLSSMKDAALFVPSKTSAIARQITARNPAILLDMWCFPLLAASTAPLYRLPLPCYADSDDACSPTPTRGSFENVNENENENKKNNSTNNNNNNNNKKKKKKTTTTKSPAVLAIESAHFAAWTSHLHAKARVLSPDPSARRVAASQFGAAPRPLLFCVADSAHPSQSDFAVLFPRLSRRAFGAERPERVLRLNVRAMLQFLRVNGFSGAAAAAVAGTARGDLVEGGCLPCDDGGGGGGGGSGEGDCCWVEWDAAILERDGGVEAWRWIDVVGLGDEAYPSELEMAEGRGAVPAGEGEKEMRGEMEPSLGEMVEGVHESEK